MSINFMIMIAIKCNHLKRFKEYIQNNALDDEVIDYLIAEQKIEFLKEYAMYHTLKEDQIRKIFSPSDVSPLMLAMARVLTLGEEEQKLLIAKKNAMLFEAYLFPKGIFEITRRFKNEAETLFVATMAEMDSHKCTEAYKTYVDNHYRRMLTMEVIEIIIEYPKSYASTYLLQRAKLKKEYEGFFVENAPRELLAHYLEYNDLNQEYAQEILLRRDFELASFHQEKYGLRQGVQRVFFEERQWRKGK